MLPSLAELMPTELLLMIFDHFRPQSHKATELATVRTLASVCRRWREIVCGTPAFWIYVTLNESPTERLYHLTSYLARLRSQLGRTQDTLLNISWYIGGAGPNYRLLRMIEEFAPLKRWRSLKI